MLIYANEVDLWTSKCGEPISTGLKNLSIGTKHTPVSDFVAKLEHFIFFWL